MKFIFAQDLNFLTEGGGAQMTDRAHCFEGIRRGHDIDLWTPQTPIDPDTISTGTAVIASNSLFLYPQVFHRLQERGIPYIYFFHDYAPVCKYRLFYPMAEVCLTCYRQKDWVPVLGKARLLIWLSPLHQVAWLHNMPLLGEVPYHLSPSPVNPDDFRDLGKARTGVVAVESLSPFKGRKHVLEWAEQNPDQQVTFIGGNPVPDEPLPANCRVVGNISYGNINEVYNQFEYFLHLPQSPSPFDRAPVEAYLAGCKILGNGNIGAFSWPWWRNGREAVVQALRESSKNFWEAVEGAL